MIRLLLVLLSLARILGGTTIETEIMCGLPKTDALLEVNSCKSAEDYYDDIPVSIRESFENSGWSWYVYEDGPLAGKYNYPVSIIGMTD